MTTSCSCCRCTLDRDLRFEEDEEETDPTEGAEDLLDTLSRLDILVDALLVDDVREDDNLSGEGDLVLELRVSSKGPDLRRPKGSAEVGAVQALVGMVMGGRLHAVVGGIKELFVVATVETGALLLDTGG